MKASAVLFILGLLAVALLPAHVFAQGCGMPNMKCGGGTCAAPETDATAAPADNFLHVTGTVVALTDDGRALLDIGTTRVVVAPPAPDEQNPAPAPFKVGDHLQIAGVLQAVSVAPAPAQTDAAGTTATFKVGNILCGMCSAAVQRALQQAPGVKQVSVDAAGIAIVGYDPAVTNTDALALVIVGAKHPHGMKFTAALQ